MGSEDIFALMASRRSCRRFTPRPVELDKVLQCVQAAALAPSSGNIQNWGFIVITDIDSIRELYHHTLDQEPFLSAMAAVLVVGDTNTAHRMYGMRGKRLYTIQNCAAATQNFLLGATALGLGSIWIGAFDEDKVSEMFGIPSDKQRPQAIILLGYPDYEPEEKQFRDLDHIVWFNKYGNRVKRPHLVYFDWATEWQNKATELRRHLDWVKFEMRTRKKNDDKQDDKHGSEKQQVSEQVKEWREKGSEGLNKMNKHIKELFESMKKDEYKEK